MTEWNIQSRAHACAACGKPFADQEAYRREARRYQIKMMSFAAVGCLGVLCVLAGLLTPWPAERSEAPRRE